MMTDARLWLLTGALVLGVALAWATRWKPPSRRVRAWMVPWGLNLAALAFLGAVLLAGNRPDNVVHTPLSWAVTAGAGALWTFFVFRFPRSVGLPLLAVTGVLAWMLTVELAGYFPLGGTGEVARVRVLGQTAQTRTVEVRQQQGGLVAESLSELPAAGWPLPRVDVLELPAWVPVPERRWYRAGEPPAAFLGLRLVPPPWVRTVNPPPVSAPQPFVVYDLRLGPGPTTWQQIVPALTP